MKKSKVKELLQIEYSGLTYSDGWATSRGYTKVPLTDNQMHSYDRNYIVECKLVIGSRHVIPETMLEQSSIDLVSYARHKAAEGIFQELYGKIVHDLVRYRHLVWSGQMDRTEATTYIDNMIQDLES